MTKKALIDALSTALDCPRTEALRIVDTYQSILLEQIIHQGDVMIQGVGSLKIKTRQERQGRNPKTGESLMIPARKVLSFKASAPFLRLLNA